MLVHVWNFHPNHGALVNGFYASDFGGVHFIGCQVDAKTFEVPFRIDGTNHPSIMVGCQILCDDGTDNTGSAIQIGTGGKVSAVANVITCDASHRFAADFSGDLTGLSVIGQQNRNVVTPVAGPGVRAAGAIRSVSPTDLSAMA